jgi:hypothetical protein
VVSAQFHDFFLGAAGVAGALIGLLFVAISVTPGAATGKAGHLYQQVRAAAAMSMFIDALVISLLALIPGGQYLGNGSTALAIVGLTSTAALIITVVRAHDPSHTIWETGRMLALFAAVLAVYALQLVSALQINGVHADNGQVTNQATLVIIMFLMGIARAWEIVGASRPRMLDLLAHESHSHPASDSHPDPASEAAQR